MPFGGAAQACGTPYVAWLSGPSMEDQALAAFSGRVLANPNEEWTPWEQAKAELDALP